MTSSLLIAGTDTDSGKTALTLALAAYWRTYRPATSLGLMKLVQAGRGDAECYRELFGQDEGLAIRVPLAFEMPVAPPLAAAREERPLDLGAAWQALQALQRERDFVLIESLGGLGSPVTEELTVGEVAAAWHLPTLLVVPVQLGAIAQAVSNVALARQAGVPLQGLVLNCAQPQAGESGADWAPSALMESLTGVPVWGTLPYLASWRDHGALARAASELALERLR
jgi:dethiobiotin synthetase